jgi:hypothetical protein
MYQRPAVTQAIRQATSCDFSIVVPDCNRLYRAVNQADKQAKTKPLMISRSLIVNQLDFFIIIC